MSSSAFQLRLDTTAPRLTWGAVTGADPGDTLRVAYALDEPQVESAELQLADRTLAMSVGVLTLDVAVPDDTGGDGQVVAHVVDNAGNRASYTLAISLGGVAPPPPVPPPSTGGMPRGPVSQPVTVVLATGGGRALSGELRVEALVRHTSALVTRSTYTTPSDHTVRLDGAIGTRSGPWRFEATVSSNSTLRTGGPPDRISRRDGPDFEDELILLGIL